MTGSQGEPRGIVGSAGEGRGARRPAGTRFRVRAPAVLAVTLLVVFVVSRLLFLDADPPPWGLAYYQPLDELFYTISSFNLFHYGAWAHQIVPFVRDDSNPLNVLQGLVTWGSLEAFGNTYWGLRVASVAVATGSFALMGALLWRAVPARDTHGPSEGVGRTTIVGLWMTVALFDFSFLVAGRVAEPTLYRVLALSGILLCCSFGYFSAARRALRSFELGLLTGAAIAFVYLYDAFLLPGVFVALLFWSGRSGWRNLTRQALAFLAGNLVVAVAYFGFVWSVYRLRPGGWYARWITQFNGTTRTSGLAFRKFAAIGTANIFRLDPGLLVVFLLALPLFVYVLLRYRGRLETAVASILLCLVAQSWFVNDVPQRKGLTFLPLVLVVVAVAQAHLVEVTQRMPWRRRTWLAAAGAALAVLVAVAALHFAGSLDRTYAWVTPLGMRRLALAGALAAAVILVALAVCGARSRGLRRVLLGTLAVALIVPGAALAWRYVYQKPTYDYRDSMKSAAPYFDGKITGGGLAYAMRLYNTSEPVLSGYVAKPEPAYYWSAMRRLAREHISAGTFGYTGVAAQRRRMTSAGYRLVQTYPMPVASGDLGGIGRFIVQAGQ